MISNHVDNNHGSIADCTRTMAVPHGGWSPQCLVDQVHDVWIILVLSDVSWVAHDVLESKAGCGIATNGAVEFATLVAGDTAFVADNATA